MRILLLIPAVRRLHDDREKWRVLALALWNGNVGRSEHEAARRLAEQRRRRDADRWQETQPVDPRRLPRDETNLAP